MIELGLDVNKRKPVPHSCNITVLGIVMDTGQLTMSIPMEYIRIQWRCSDNGSTRLMH